MTFDGTGALPNYTAASDTSSFMYNATPWWSARAQVKKVVVKSGITSVGALSLAHLNYASEIVIEGETTKVLSNSISYNYNAPQQKVIATLISTDEYALSAASVADKSDSISNELLSRIGKRVPIRIKNS